jgi:hypothetical protein
MTTILTSTITTVDIEKLKYEFQSSGFILLNVIPTNGILPTTAELAGTIINPQLAIAQNILDSHIDTKLENITLSGKDEAVLSTTNPGSVKLNVQGQGWLVNSSRDLIPSQDNSYKLGTPTNKISEVNAENLNLSGNAIIQGDLTVNGTNVILNTTTLAIEDNEIILNANTVGFPVLDAQIRIERSLAPDALVKWDETLEEWQVGVTGNIEKIATSSDLSSISGHISNTSNPHSVTKAQVGLSDVTNDAQLTRGSGDFSNGITQKSSPVGADRILIEDSAASNAKKFIIVQNINHADLAGSGFNSHALIDAHLASTTNPHSVTKTQVGLANVTNDAQLKRGNADFTSFSQKTSPSGSDVIVIEDSADSFSKKYILFSDLPTAGGSVDLTSNQTVAGIKTFTSEKRLKNHSGYTGSERKEQTFALTTTNATAQTIFSITPSNNSMTKFRIDIHARLGANSPIKGYWTHIIGVVSKDNSANCVLVGNPFKMEDEINLPGYTTSITVSGGTLNILVAGALSETVHWVGDITFQELVSSS